MAPATPCASPRSPAAEVDDNDLRRGMLDSVLRVCQVVFGTTSIALAVVGLWYFARGEVGPVTLAALWFIPGFNTLWSVLTLRRNRVSAELIRGLVCLPVATYLYVAETGLFHEMWIPSLLMMVGVALCTGIATSRSLLGYLVTVVYAGALLAVAALEFGSTDITTIDDALGMAVTGCVLSIAAAKLGRTLEEARRQRDVARNQKDRAEIALQQLTERSTELTAALESSRKEMEHRIRVEVELRQAQKLESLGRLAAGVAHEINTPIQFVSDSIQFVRDGTSELFELVDNLKTILGSVIDGAPLQDAAALVESALDTADAPYLVENVPVALDRASEGLNRVITIVRSMKEFSHPDSKEMEYADLNNAIESALTMARNEYKTVADVETDFGELPSVRCHIGELHQVVLNLVINAAHAIDDVVHGTNTRGCIRVRTYREGDDVVIAIADTGTGIPEGARSHIFDPFFTTKEVGRGTGQGLSIAHSVIVDRHHGQLGFDTEIGKGTTFHVQLPIDGSTKITGVMQP